MQAQLADIDLTIVKQSGCLSERDFCRQFKPGQRLLHAWAAGVPTIVVKGSSAPIEEYLGDTPPLYPAEAVVESDGCDGTSWHERADGSQYAKVGWVASSGERGVRRVGPRSTHRVEQKWATSRPQTEGWAPNRPPQRHAATQHRREQTTEFHPTSAPDRPDSPQPRRP